MARALEALALEEASTGLPIQVLGSERSVRIAQCRNVNSSVDRSISLLTGLCFHETDGAAFSSSRYNKLASTKTEAIQRKEEMQNDVLVV